MNNVTQADRDAAERHFVKWYPNTAWGFEAMAETLAAHRITSCTAKDAEIAALKAERDAALARVAELEGEYICKCGQRVEPHKCHDSEGVF